MTNVNATSAAPAPAGNPVFAPGPVVEGLHNFPEIADIDFAPAADEALSEHLAEIEKIANQSAAPTFDNTIVALERSGHKLRRLTAAFYNLDGADTTPARSEFAEQLTLRLTEHRLRIAMNESLFQRLHGLWERRAELGDEPRQRLVERYHRDAVRAGAGLGGAERERFTAVESRLATLTAQYQSKLRAEANDSAVHFADADALRGLPEAEIAAAAAAAADKGTSGYLIALELPTSQGVLNRLENPASRAAVHGAALARGTRGNENDTRKLVSEIATLRAEKAKLLGYRTFADYVVAAESAPSVEAVRDLLHQVATAAVAAGGRELTALTELAGGYLEASDVQYWLRRQEQAQTAAAQPDLSDYLELDQVLRDGVFYAAEILYGMRFIERPAVPVYHPDVRVFEVRGETNQRVGFYLLDPYARPSKRGGAWMNTFTDQSTLLDNRPVVVNVLNIVKPHGDSPTLLTRDNLRTLFHEFGHALHGLLSSVTYPTQSGTHVSRDFVEFPSQVNEMWAYDPTVLGNYAKHHQTGEAIPDAVATAAASGAQKSAFATLEYVAAALVDLAWHDLEFDNLPDDIGDVEAFERRALEEAGVYSELIPPRYRSTYFNHIFASEWYSACYYSYLWSEVLDAATEQWFRSGGGLQRSLGKRFAAATLSRGDSVDPIAAHQELLGAAPAVEHLLRRRGLLD